MNKHKTLLTATLLVIGACSAASPTGELASKVQCRADNVVYGKPIPVPVQDIGFGTENSGDCRIVGPSFDSGDLNPDRFAACVYGSSPYEQSFLLMALDHVSSVIYDFEAIEPMAGGRILNIMSAGDTRFQCWLEQ